MLSLFRELRQPCQIIILRVLHAVEKELLLEFAERFAFRQARNLHQLLTRDRKLPL